MLPGVGMSPLDVSYLCGLVQCGTLTVWSCAIACSISPLSVVGCWLRWPPCLWESLVVGHGVGLPFPGLLGAFGDDWYHPGTIGVPL